MKPREIVKRIMSAHWDVKCCDCWICKAGRNHGFGAKDTYLHEKRKYEVPCMDDVKYRAGGETEKPPLPVIGSQWRHLGGHIYVVYDITNSSSNRKDFPTRVSYHDDLDKLIDTSRYSRDLDDFLEKFTKI